MALRVLHCRARAGLTDEELARYAAAARSAAGCVEAYGYRSVEDETSVAVAELWADEAAYAAFWSVALAEGTVPGPLVEPPPQTDQRPCATELYRHRYFARVDGIWAAKDGAADPGRISWPARGAVRVVIQAARATSGPNANPADRAAETRREPGCLQFEGYRSVEVPQDTLVLELWADQVSYDRHWRLRLATQAAAAPASPAPSVTRTMGSFGIEFYRHSAFRPLYGRWLPAEGSAWADTVVWPD